MAGFDAAAVGAFVYGGGAICTQPGWHSVRFAWSLQSAPCWWRDRTRSRRFVRSLAGHQSRANRVCGHVARRRGNVADLTRAAAVGDGGAISVDHGLCDADLGGVGAASEGVVCAGRHGHSRGHGRLCQVMVLVISQRPGFLFTCAEALSDMKKKQIRWPAKHGSFA